MNPQTIGDVIATQTTAAASQAAAGTAAAAADTALAGANTSLASANAVLAADLASVGPVFTIDTLGNVTVYFPDSTATGFHTIVPLPTSTPLPTPTVGAAPTATS
jgi:hypothetical protein